MIREIGIWDIRGKITDITAKQIQKKLLLVWVIGGEGEVEKWGILCIEQIETSSYTPGIWLVDVPWGREFDMLGWGILKPYGRGT